MTDTKKTYKPELAILFWKRDGSQLTNHGNGLSDENIKYLRELKVGDRLVIWQNTFKNQADLKSHDFILKVFKPGPKPTAEEASGL